MKSLFSVGVFLFSFSSFAGEEGFFYQGKHYTVYKDGKKVNPTFEELKIKQRPSKEKPTDFHGIHWIKSDDKKTTCYLLYGNSISCVANHQ